MREFSNHAVLSMSDSIMPISSKYTQDLSVQIVSFTFSFKWCLCFYFWAVIWNYIVDLFAGLHELASASARITKARIIGARAVKTLWRHLKWTNQSWRWNDFASGRYRGPHYKCLRKAEEANFKANFSFFTSLSTCKGHVFGVTFITLYGTVGFISIRDFSFWGESDF